MNRKDKAKNVKKSIIEVNSPQGYMVPNAVDVKDFARSRMNEINLITKELEQAKYSSTRRVFQQLPRHMRRRAASYNIKRLPTRLRLRAIEEMKGDPPKGKCSKNMKNCRRWRRRSSNITSEFKAKKGWLETHFWHAKRCKMIDYWGYKVAAHLNEKCLKSTYRSSINGVLLHDFSYWTPFWMECDLEKLMKVHGQDDIIDIVLFHENVQICPIKIFSRTFKRPILFLHPAAIETGIIDHAAFKEFSKTFGLTLIEASEQMCTFRLCGPKSQDSILKLTNSPAPISYPLKVQISDPRYSVKSCKLIGENFDEHFMDHSSIKSFDEINSEKSQLFIASELNNSNDKLELAVTRKNSEYFISCPRKWARIIWYELIKIKPVKVAGIDQIDVIAFENESPVFPRDFVASPAYNVWAEREKLRLEAAYKRKPPAKRPSFAKFGIETPFKPCFDSFGALCKAVIEIEGKGIVTTFAEIYTPEKILMGYATSTSNSSLKKGLSSAIVSVSRNLSENLTKVLVRNYCSPDTFRTAKIKFI